MSDDPERWRRYSERNRRLQRDRCPDSGAYRWFDHRLHDCGCETAFDCDAWTSVTLERCANHAAIAAEADQ